MVVPVLVHDEQRVIHRPPEGPAVLAREDVTKDVPRQAADRNREPLVPPVVLGQRGVPEPRVLPGLAPDVELILDQTDRNHDPDVGLLPDVDRDGHLLPVTHEVDGEAVVWHGRQGRERGVPLHALPDGLEQAVSEQLLVLEIL